MLEFEDSARSEAPPEEVWKILYDPTRFSQWWEGMETTSVGDGEFTLQQVGVPELQIPNRLEVRDAGSAVVISCLLHDFVYDWRLEPLDGGRATRISVHVAIPDEKVERFERFQWAMMGASVRRLAEIAAETNQVAQPVIGRQGPRPTFCGSRSRDTSPAECRRSRCTRTPLRSSPSDSIFCYAGSQSNSNQRTLTVTYVITEPCIGLKDYSCVEVCPVDCIHPTTDEADYAQVDQLFIDPEECIDCDACVEACPVDAIFAEDQVPEEWQGFTELNAAYFRDRAA